MQCQVQSEIPRIHHGRCSASAARDFTAPQNPPQKPGRVFHCREKPRRTPRWQKRLSPDPALRGKRSPRGAGSALNPYFLLQMGGARSSAAPAHVSSWKTLQGPTQAWAAEDAADGSRAGQGGRSRTTQSHQSVPKSGVATQVGAGFGIHLPFLRALAGQVIACSPSAGWRW